MKKLLVLVAVLFFFGCNTTRNNSQKNINQINKTPILNDQATLEKVKTVGLGEACGEDMCETGLYCKTNSENKNGICVETVVQKELECSTNKEPVCGLKDNKKNGYLNECEAIRHGAKVLNAGFCKVDKTIENSCEADFISIGNCRMVLTGFVFDKKENACVQKTAGGCEAEIPFKSLEDCQAKCVK